MNDNVIKFPGRVTAVEWLRSIADELEKRDDKDSAQIAIAFASHPNLSGFEPGATCTWQRMYATDRICAAGIFSAAIFDILSDTKTRPG